MSIEHVVELFSRDGEEFIIEAYRCLLGREPDVHGMAYYLGRLSMGYGKAAVIVQLAQSKEARPTREIAGLKKLIAEEGRANHWFWGVFGQRNRQQRLTREGVRNIEGMDRRITYDRKIIQELSFRIDGLIRLAETVTIKSDSVIPSLGVPQLRQPSADDVRQVFCGILGREPVRDDEIEDYLKIESPERLINSIMDLEEFKSVIPENAKLNIKKLIEENKKNFGEKSVVDISALVENYVEGLINAPDNADDSPGVFVGVEQRRSYRYAKSLKPKVQLYVVIPSYEDSVVLEKCLNSINRFGFEFVTGIIISDDCSPSEVHKKFLANLENSHTNRHIQISIIRGQKNSGFSANVNRGLRAAPKDADILLLNSDTEITKFAIPALMMRARISEGIAGARLLYPNLKIQHGGGFRNFNALDWFDHRYRLRDRFFTPALFTYNTLFCTGAALYIPQVARNTVGYFDEKFGMGFEDVDYCIRAWKNKVPVSYVGAAEIIHHESATRGVVHGTREIESQKYFWSKNGGFFHRSVKGANGIINIIFVLKDTGIGGGHRVIFRFSELLAGLKGDFSVEIWSLADKPDWFSFKNFVNFRKFADFAKLELALSSVDGIKVATWWETAEFVWRASLFRGVPAWLSQDMETSYYKNRDTLNMMKAHASYAPEFIYLTDYKWLSDLFASDFFYHSHMVGLGVDLDIFRCEKSIRKKKSVLACARGEPLKGFGLTKEIIKVLVENGFNVTLYGLDVDLISGLSGVNFIFKPTNEELNILYNTNEYFLQTSIHEGLGLPPLEAMACNCIPVVTDAFGNREYIKDGFNCIVIPRDPSIAADAIIEKTYEENIINLSGGMNETLNNYSWSDCFNRLRDIFMNIGNNPIYGKTKY